MYRDVLVRGRLLTDMPRYEILYLGVIQHLFTFLRAVCVWNFLPGSEILNPEMRLLCLPFMRYVGMEFEFYVYPGKKLSTRV
jgi:hypothetical protein